MRSLLLAACLTSVSTPVLAQQGDVVMRRPLPVKPKVTSTQDGCELTNSCPPPSPTPDGPIPPKPQDPSEPTVGTVAYGYSPECRNPGAAPVCNKITFEKQRWGDQEYLSTMWQRTDESFCKITPDAEQLNAIRYAGLIPGGPNATPQAFCEGPNVHYGYGQTCTSDNEGKSVWYYECYALDASAPGYALAPVDKLKCQSNPGAGPAWFLERYGMATQEMVDNKVNQYDCSGDPVDPPTVDPDPDPEDPSNPDENTPTPTPDEPLPPGVYTWKPGPWQGTSTCGVQTTLMRGLSCQAAITIDPWYTEVTEVPTSACDRMASEPRPATTYTGDKAGCSYTVDETFDGVEWLLPVNAPYGDTATCSDHAYRDAIQTCRDATNNVVDMSYCVENYTSGGTRHNQPGRQTGNTSGCSAEWKLVVGDSYCTGGNQQDSDYVMDVVDTACVKRGKRVYGVEEAACPADDRPMTPTTLKVGECKVGYWEMSYYSGTCISPEGMGVPDNPSNSGDHGDPSDEFIPIPDAYGGSWNGNLRNASPESFAAANSICMAANASCCAIERVPYYGEMNVRVHKGRWTVNPAYGSPRNGQYYGVSDRRTRINYWDVDYSKIYTGDECTPMEGGEGCWGPVG